VDCDLQDEAAWKAANPALDVFRSRADVKAQAEQAERMPSAENGFRNLTLNQRVNSFSPFVSPSVWKAGNGPVADFGEALVFGGLDLSATTDLTALVLVARIDGILHVQPHFWMPADSVASAAKRDRAPYDVWVKQGFLRTTQGKVIDYSFVANDIAEICSGLNIQKIAFDRWRMDRLTTELDRAGISLPVEPFGQGFASMSPALEALESDLLQDRLIHGGQPVLTMCAANAVSVSDPAGSRKLEKNKSTGRIDGLVALAMACGIEATNGGEVSTASPWDDPTFSLFNGT
jgi:phage terminase large subunit-like protein